MDNKCVVVGIAGGSGSGKTSFCSELEEQFKDLRVKVIHTDNYFKNIKPMTKAPFSNKEYSDYDHPDSVDFENLCNDFNYSISSNLYDIVSKKEIKIEPILEKISDFSTEKIIFHYTPPYRDIQIESKLFTGNEILFVKTFRGNSFPLYIKHPLMSQA